MKTPRELFKAAIRRNGLTRPAIAKSIGISARSLENVLSGAPGKRARQRITNAVQTEIWPGVRVTERVVTIPAGTIYHWPNEEQTMQFLTELGSSGTEIRKGSVKVLNDAQMRWTFDDSKPALSEAECERIFEKNDPANVIHVYGPEGEALAIADADKLLATASRNEDTHTQPKASAS